jgi:hypothetical protein
VVARRPFFRQPRSLALDQEETVISQETVDGQRVDLRSETPQVRDALAALARLLGAAVAEPPRNLASFVNHHLGTGAAGVASVTAVLRGVDAPLVQVAVARLLERAPSAVLTDDVGTGPPGYQLVTVDIGEEVAAPDDVAAFVPAGAVFDFDAVILLTWDRMVEKLSFCVRRADHERARAALSELVAEARGPANFYRGKTLRVDVTDQGVSFTPIAPAPVGRDELVLPSAVWKEIDANVHGLVQHGDVLTAAGLGTSRGLLVVGSPGVGKTALCRVIATELPPGTTILLVDAGVSARGLGLLYESLPPLAPAAVFLDDIDLLAGDRRGGTGGAALRELLTHLDGFAPPGAVVTVATTNDMTTIDPALIRAGRFDIVIEIGRPDRSARAKILHRCLRPLGDFEVDRLAQCTDGASGADLREIVRRAVLERGRALTEADLLDVVATGRWKPAPPTGQYL